MQPPSETAPVLDYQRSTTSSVRPWILLPFGLVPFGIELILIFWEGMTGDPPGFVQFKTYHYMIALAELLAIGWLVWMFRLFCTRRRWWVLIIAIPWCAWMCWIGYIFLRDIHGHPAGQYYWSIW